MDAADCRNYSSYSSYLLPCMIVRPYLHNVRRQRAQVQHFKCAAIHRRARIVGQYAAIEEYLHAADVQA